jgi:hypothetical protein
MSAQPAEAWAEGADRPEVSAAPAPRAEHQAQVDLEPDRWAVAGGAKPQNSECS